MALTFTWMKTSSGRKHPLKFLVVKKGKDNYEVLAGRFEFHTYIIGIRNDEPPNRKELVKKHKIVGAGVFEENGYVGYWSSFGLKVETPLNLRPAIETLIKDNSSYFRRESKETSREKKIR